jgi:hypothetical protein
LPPSICGGFFDSEGSLPEHMIGADAAFPEEHFKLQSDTINQGMEEEGGAGGSSGLQNQIGR